MSRYSVEFDSLSEILKRRGLNEGGRVQQYIDNTVIKYCDPLVPKDSGMLKNSAQSHSVIGSGTVWYVTPYAHFQYTKNKSISGRGREWFERMKKEKKEEILKGASKVAGGEIN